MKCLARRPFVTYTIHNPTNPTEPYTVIALLRILHMYAKSALYYMHSTVHILHRIMLLSDVQKKKEYSEATSNAAYKSMKVTRVDAVNVQISKIEF